MGNFFGVNDEWKKIKLKKTFFTKEQVEDLFSEFEIIGLKEVEGDAITAGGKMKHWHFFSVVAKKNNVGK